MENGFFILEVTTKRKYVIQKSNNWIKTIEYISKSNSDAKYLENDTIDEFLYKDYDDGFYIVCDDLNDRIKVYKISTVVSVGYIYNSTYKNKEVVKEYELIDNRME